MKRYDVPNLNEMRNQSMTVHIRKDQATASRATVAMFWRATATNETSQTSFSRNFCKKKLCTLLDLCVSSLRRGHANLLCIVPILTDDPRRESENTEPKSRWTTGTQLRKTQSQPKLRRLPGSFPEISRKLPRHRLGRLYTVWAGCTQSGPTVRSLGRLYTVWADCRFF